MKHELDAQRMAIYVGEDDKWRAGLLYPAIVEALKEAGIAGVTVLHGIEGFGASHRLHTARFEVLFQGLPVVIEAVDSRESIATALQAVEPMLTDALVTICEVRAIFYAKDA